MVRVSCYFKFCATSLVVILKSAHYNYPTYKLLERWDTETFIDLNERNKGNVQYTECGITINENGVPVCKSGEEMANWGPDYDRRRSKWRYPHATRKHFECPYFNRDYGRIKYTKLNDEVRSISF